MRALAEIVNPYTYVTPDLLASRSRNGGLANLVAKLARLPSPFRVGILERERLSIRYRRRSGELGGQRTQLMSKAIAFDRMYNVYSSIPILAVYWHTSHTYSRRETVARVAQVIGGPVYVP